MYIICLFASLGTGNIVYWNTFEYLSFSIGTIGVYAGILMAIWFLGKRFLSKNILMEKNIIFRNGYYALRGEYLSDSQNQPRENDKELEERKKFENTDVYKEWKKKNPELTSWNYGLSISWDNNPEKDDVNYTKKDSSIEYYI